MRRAVTTRAAVEGHGDVTLPEGCILCGGPLALRVREGTARTYCAACHWISHPHMRRAGGAIHVVHPAGGHA
jgi:hypothetical protein